ncbi:MAG: serine hydrolase [Micromonosporaceae bacterium]
MKSPPHRWRYVAGLAVLAAVVATLTVPSWAGVIEELTPPSGADRSDREKANGEDLAPQLRKALNAQNFENVVDTAPAQGAGPRRIHQTPNVDATVIKLSEAGRPTVAADVLLSPQYPDGKVVPLDEDLSTDQVRWRRWNDSQWDNNKGRGSADVTPGHKGAPIDFMSPYPASVLKLMVGYGVLRLADQGEITLGEDYAYRPTGSNPLCGGDTTKPVRTLFDEMITVSRNQSTCALIKLLHDHGAIGDLNRHFTDLGLPMLRLAGTDPGTGGNWAGVNMNALDTAKLLLAVNGGAGVLWNAPDGDPVTNDVLSASSRKFYLNTLGEQGLNQVLSTTNWCGRNYPAQGIPQRTDKRWIDRQDGTMTVDGRVYGRDVRPCQKAAEVTYAHKTGFVDTSGNDAGIVKSLPGKPKRNYIVAVHSNLGERYTDPRRPDDPAGVNPVTYTEKYGKLGHAIDKIVTRL